MALPIWGLYMTKNYANKEIGVSDGNFKSPANMSINLDCSKVREEDRANSKPAEDDLDDIDF